MTDTIRLTLQTPPPFRVWADAIAPDRLAVLSATEIARLTLWPARRGGDGGRSDQTGQPGRSIELGEMFAVNGERAASVEMQGNLSGVDGLGTAMAGGRLAIEGSVGDETGRQMTGGTLTVHGSAGDRAGLAMVGGTLRISGDVGNGLGGSIPGASAGMTGGEILVGGRAGCDAAVLVRRGLVVVGGDAGSGAGRGMIAGTLLVLGRIAGSVGEWNKRGSIIAVGGASIPLTYRYACTYQPQYLRLLCRYVRACDFPVDDRVDASPYARHCGDLSQLGKGEILVRVSQ